jgi:hypothetical protein
MPFDVFFNVQSHSLINYLTVVRVSNGANSGTKAGPRKWNFWLMFFKVYFLVDKNYSSFIVQKFMGIINFLNSIVVKIMNTMP